MITPERGVVLAQRYELTRPLAQGGMGSVWIARHRDLEVDVTIKFMAPSLIASADARTRFEREARVAARLESQHVVHVHDYGVEDGMPYMVMELLKGESLWTRLARDGTLPLDASARLLVQMCKALRTAHEAGLVHRDLKPGNVFLARKDEDEVVKILDFGIAKTTDLGDAQASTETGVLMGSVHYMSPEQIRSSRAVDHRSDLWSIGVILYRALGGRLPFPGEKLGDVLVRVCTDAFPPLSSIAPDLPPGIDAFFARALARDPDQRFQSAMEMAEAFSAMVTEATAPPASDTARATLLRSPLPPAPAPPAPAPPARIAARTVPLPPPAVHGAAAYAPPVRGAAAYAPPAHGAAAYAPPAQGAAAYAPPAQGAASYAPPAQGAASYAPRPTPEAPATRPPAPAPQAPAARPPAPVPQAPPAEAASQITSLNVASSSPRPSRAPLLLALAAPFAFVVVGGVVVLWRLPRAEAPAPSLAASAAPAPSSSAASSAVSPSPSSSATAAPAVEDTPRPIASTPAAPEPVPSASSPANRPPGQPIRPGASRPAASAGCNPPYTVDARGVRVPKMECL
jgi:serine/threonine-protein kinase